MSNEIDRLELDAMNVQLFLRKLELLKLEAQHREALYRLHQLSAQSRPPAANAGEAKSEGAPARAEARDLKPAANAEPGK